MKILMLNHEFPPVGGGASPVTFELCTHLAKLGHFVDVITMHYKDTPRYERVNGFDVYRTPALRGKPNICYPHELATYLPGAFFKTLKLCRQNKYDVIHCHFLVPGAPLAYLINKITKIPFIVTCHGSDVPGHNPDRFALLHKLIKPTWKVLAGRAKSLTSPSELLKQRILNIDNALNVQVIPNGIDTSRFITADKKKSILLCSRIFKFKGFQYFINAVKDLKLDWEIDIVGDGPYLPELKKLAENSQTKINFKGWLDKNSNEYIKLYSQASIFVFLSSSESFGLVVAEAMAAGCAIVASDIPAHREVLAGTGLFVNPEKIEQIRANIKKLIDDNNLRQNFQQKAIKRICDEFSWDKIANQYIELYKKYACRL